MDAWVGFLLFHSCGLSGGWGGAVVLRDYVQVGTDIKPINHVVCIPLPRHHAILCRRCYLRLQVDFGRASVDLHKLCRIRLKLFVKLPTSFRPLPVVNNHDPELFLLFSRFVPHFRFFYNNLSLLQIIVNDFTLKTLTQTITKVLTFSPKIIYKNVVSFALLFSKVWHANITNYMSKSK